MLQCLNPCQLHHYFVDFVNMKCMSWFTFLHLEKMELCFVLFCFVLLVTEVKVFYLNDPPFCFWYRNIDMSNFCVGLVGGGRDGWGELRSEPRAAHVFFIFQIKKELFIFIFQIKSISKGTFWKKGTKWQSLVNSRGSPPRPARKNDQIRGEVAGQKKGHILKTFQKRKVMMEQYCNTE